MHNLLALLSCVNGDQWVIDCTRSKVTNIQFITPFLSYFTHIYVTCTHNITYIHTNTLLKREKKSQRQIDKYGFLHCITSFTNSHHAYNPPKLHELKSTTAIRQMCSSLCLPV